MNERGVEALVAAALRGQKQITGGYADGSGGMCAVGVLVAALGMSMSEQHYVGAPSTLWDKYGLRVVAPAAEDMPCSVCGESFGTEESYIVHLNDTHGLDFLAIARKLGPDAA